MYQLTEKLINLVPYEPETGDYKIRLDANESFLEPVKELQDVINMAVKQVTYNRYPDPKATRLCNFFAQYHEIDSGLITAGNGSDELISVIINCFLKKGDTIVTVSPDFSMYNFYGSLAESNIVTLSKNENLQINVDELIHTVNEQQAAMLIFSNPCNPTSLGLKRKDVLKIIESVNALVVIDEAYMDFWTETVIKEVTEYDNLIILRTCSKMMGMAAMRLGFAVANKTLTNALQAAKSPYNVNALTQAVGAALLAHPDDIRDSVTLITETRNDLYLTIKDIAQGKQTKVFETCANFILIKPRDAAAVSEGLKKEGILVRHLGEYLRITVGSPVENRALVAALLRLL